jgi:hypothetical protein
MKYPKISTNNILATTMPLNIILDAVTVVFPQVFEELYYMQSDIFKIITSAPRSHRLHIEKRKSKSHQYIVYL